MYLNKDSSLQGLDTTIKFFLSNMSFKEQHLNPIVTLKLGKSYNM